MAKSRKGGITQLLKEKIQDLEKKVSELSAENLILKNKVGQSVVPKKGSIIAQMNRRRKVRKLITMPVENKAIN